MRRLLRTGRPDDLGALLRIEKLCFEKGRFPTKWLQQILRGADSAALVEDSGEGLDGAALLRIEAGVCRVLSVAVLPSARRRGVGTRLMRGAERLARERRCRTMRLEVETSNRAAFQLYRKLGYRTDGILPGYYSWGEDAYSMSKPIQSPTAVRPP